MQAVSLSDEMLQTLTMLSQPIRPNRRDAYLKEVGLRLGRERVLGEGKVSRIAREVQREFLFGPVRAEVTSA